MTNFKFSTFIFLLALANINYLYTQKAKVLLDTVFNNYNSYNTLLVSFKYFIKSNYEEIVNSEKGKILLKNDKYRMYVMGIEQIFDGQKLYTISDEFREVNISTEKSENILSPSHFLGLYKYGYILELDIEQKIDNRIVQYIKLIPKEKNQDIEFILIGIDKNKFIPYKFIQVGNNGVRSEVNIITWEPNIKMDNQTFIFNQEKYKDYLLIDHNG